MSRGDRDIQDQHSCKGEQRNGTGLALGCGIKEGFVVCEDDAVAQRVLEKGADIRAEHKVRE